MAAGAEALQLEARPDDILLEHRKLLLCGGLRSRVLRDESLQIAVVRRHGARLVRDGSEDRCVTGKSSYTLAV
eukprot:6034102-Prymnesium_polylepis.1